MSFMFDIALISLAEKQERCWKKLLMDIVESPLLEVFKKISRRPWLYYSAVRYVMTTPQRELPGCMEVLCPMTFLKKFLREI